MRILLVNHYAGSVEHGMEFRPYYLCREWVRAGHSVTIVAASYSHVRTRQPQILRRWGLPARADLIDGIEYQWYRTPRYKGNGFGRVINIFSFLAQVWLKASRLAALRPDVVIASSTYPLDIWVARRIARIAGAKLVYEVHDLWPLSPIELGGISPYHPFIRLCQAAEDAAYRDSDVVVSMLPMVSEHMASRGLDLRKLCIVPNGVAPDDWEVEGQPLPAALVEHIAEQRSLGRTIIGYAGSHGVPNSLGVLLDAANLLRNEKFAIVMVGDGHEKPALAHRVAAENLANVAMFAPILKTQIPALLEAFDIAFIGWQRLPIYRFGIAPNKLMDYMMAKRVVLHSVEAGNDPVAEAGCGLTVPPADVRAVAQGLRQLAALSPEKRKQMGERGREFVLRNHAYPILARRFLQFVNV